MIRFKSTRKVQCFLSIYDPSRNLFRHRSTANVFEVPGILCLTWAAITTGRALPVYDAIPVQAPSDSRSRHDTLFHARSSSCSPSRATPARQFGISLSEYHSQPDLSSLSSLRRDLTPKGSENRHVQSNQWPIHVPQPCSRADSVDGQRPLSANIGGHVVPIGAGSLCNFVFGANTAVFAGFPPPCHGVRKATIWRNQAKSHLAEEAATWGFA